MSNHRVVMEPTVFIEHLRRTSPLRKMESVYSRLLLRFECYTTVINVYELYSGAKTEKKIAEADAILAPIKILSLRADYPKNIGLLSVVLRRQNLDISEFDKLIAGICLENEMPIVTRNTEHFDRVPELLAIPAGVVEAYEDAEEIVKVSRKRSESLADRGA